MTFDRNAYMRSYSKRPYARARKAIRDKRLHQQKRAKIGVVTHERLLALLWYDPATGVFYWRERQPGCRPDLVAGTLDKMNGYTRIKINARLYKTHRLAWLYVTGEWPTHEIDHRNGIRHDNQFSNLRPATRLENSRNVKRRVDNSSGVKGIYWDKKSEQWCARIKIRGRNEPLGLFSSLEQAAAAYARAACVYFGDFARIE